jgi:hypothetical protein
MRAAMSLPTRCSGCRWSRPLRDVPPQRDLVKAAPQRGEPMRPKIMQTATTRGHVPVILVEKPVASQNDALPKPAGSQEGGFSYPPQSRPSRKPMSVDRGRARVFPGDITLPLLRTGKSALLPTVNAYAAPKPAGTGLAHRRLFPYPHLSVRQRALLCSGKVAGAGPSLEETRSCLVSPVYPILFPKSGGGEIGLEWPTSGTRRLFFD